MNRSIFSPVRYVNIAGVAVGLGVGFAATAGIAQSGTNSCPVDGCEVNIAAAEMDGDELKITFDANFTPSLSKNHLHVWWGELYTVRQVTANAESEYEVEQGVWHPTDSYPTYVTAGVVAVSEREGATTICVTAADRNHEILDPELYDCQDVSDLLQ